MPLSNYAKQKVVEWLIAKNNSFNNRFYAALNTEESTAADAGAEINADWYKRTLLSVYSGGGLTDNKMTDVTIVDGVAETHNKVPVMFYKNTSNQSVTVQSITFYNAETDGSYLGYCNLSTPLEIGKNEIANFDVGELKLTLSEANETPVA